MNIVENRIMLIEALLEYEYSYRRWRNIRTYKPNVYGVLLLICHDIVNVLPRAESNVLRFKWYDVVSSELNSSFKLAYESEQEIPLLSFKYEQIAELIFNNYLDPNVPLILTWGEPDE